MKQFKVLFFMLLGISLLFGGCSSSDEELLSEECSILSFTLQGVEGKIDEASGDITLTLPAGSKSTALQPTISISDKATISPRADAEQNFTEIVSYIVKAEKGNTKKYNVHVNVTVEKSKVAEIKSFAVRLGADENVEGVIVDGTEKNTISILVPFGTDVAKMRTIIQYDGASISPAANNDEVNFTKPVVYTVTAEDETVTKSYEVTVTTEKSSEAMIEKFIISGGGLTADIVCNIDQEKFEITAEVPFGTDLTKLVPKIDFKGHKLSPESGKVVNLEKEEVPFTVTAQDDTKVMYSVTIKMIKSSDKELKEFVFKEGFVKPIVGTLNPSTKMVSVDFPFGTDLTKLKPIITHTGNMISPNSEEYQDFSQVVDYTITAQDGTKYEFSVMANVNPFETKVSSISAKTYYTDEVIHINGSFAPAIKNNEAYLNDKGAKIYLNIIEASAGYLKCTIPEGSFVGPNYNFTVNVKSYGGITGTLPNTTIQILKFEPVIQNIAKSAFLEGDVITIEGKFGTDIETTSVRLTNYSKSLDLEVTKANGSVIVAKIPESGSAGKNYRVIVTTRGVAIEYESTVNVFSLAETTPKFTGMSVTEAVTGDVPNEIIAYGVNFRNINGTIGDLYFRDATATNGARRMNIIDVNASGTELKFAPINSSTVGTIYYFFQAYRSDLKTPTDISFEVKKNLYPRPIVHYNNIVPGMPVEGEEVTVTGSNFTDHIGKGAVIEMYPMDAGGVITYPAFATINATIVDDNTLKFRPLYSEATNGRTSMTLKINGQTQTSIFYLTVVKK